VLHSPLSCPGVRAVALAFASCALISCASAPQLQPGDVLRATDDPLLIERGRYLAHGPAHCVSCHGDPEHEDDLPGGAEIPLSGGRRFELGLLGTIVAPNITADPVAGIGALSDDVLVRALRYGISHSGRPLLPFMPFADLADRDLQAIISFLRTVPPVGKRNPPSDVSWLGAFAVNVILQPQGPKEPPPLELPARRTAEYGRYLAHTIANCYGCHTRRSKLTGAFVGQPFAGGMKMVEPGGTFVTPNLTPVPDGSLQRFDEQRFVEHFRRRAQLPTQSPMPWAAYARMTNDDLGAIFRYLSALPPSCEPRSRSCAGTQSED
jgi:mono/diheme cytochrome c family protein